MSINVHVSGNPIRISRGKMVTADFDPSKKEFDQRRLIRLQQVRDQSKKIAENVRNRVKKEKLMHLKQIEEDGKQKLKNSQNRKLLELQTQYKKALKEIGLGHKEAQDIGDKEDLLEEQKIVDKEVAAKRGHKATCKLQCQKHEADYKRNAISDRKKLVREIENTRAAMLTTGAKQKLPSKTVSNKNKDNENEDFNIFIPESSLDSQDSRGSLSDITEDDEEPSSSCSCGAEDFSSAEHVDDTTKKNSYSALQNPSVATINSSVDVHMRPHSKVQPSLDGSKSVHPTKSQVTSSGPDSARITTTSSDKNQYESSHVGTTSFLTAPPSSVMAPPFQTSQLASQKSLINEQYRSQTSQGFSFADTRISDRIRGREFASHRPERLSPRLSRISEIPSSTAIRDFVQDRKCCTSCACHCAHTNADILKLGHSIYKDGVFHGGFKESEDGRTKAPPTPGSIEEQNVQHLSSKVVGSMDDSRKNSEVSKSQLNEIPSKPFIKLKPGAKKQPSMESRSPRKSAKSKTSVTKVISSKKVPPKVSSKPAEDSDMNIVTSQMCSREFDELVKPSGSKQHLLQMYDHPNRFEHERSIPSTSFVEKIPVESLEVIPDPDMEEHWQETQRRRHREAQLRGKQALEKQKLQREYEEMIKRLPLLQKKERINEIYNDKPEYHMSDERLKEREQRKQNNLENAYNKLFPDLKPAIVTLPKKHQTDEREEISCTDSADSINVANWNRHHQEPQMFSTQEARDILKSFTQRDPHDRRTKLKELLRQLQMQKEELLREISALPPDDSVADLINDLRSLDSDNEEKKKHPRKRPRKEKELDVSIDSSVEGSSSELNKLESKVVTRKSPRKKAKVKTKIIIRQNTSTQTTPKSSTREEIPKSRSPPPVLPAPPPSPHDVQPLVTCAQLHIPCDCDKENKKSCDDKCHILVKLQVNDKPEVIVNDTSTPAKSSKENYVDVGVQISEPREQRKKPKPRLTTRKIDSTLEKSRTWREQFSKNSISTTSTSYMSPPEFQRRKPRDKHDYFRKPQQGELSAAFSSQDLGDPRVFHYIEKLLNMNRDSIENLSVSTSNVETPSQSVIEMESNIPNERLVLGSLRMRGDNVDGRSTSPDYNSVPFSAGSQKEPSNSAILENDACTSSKQRILEQYAEATDTCTKRIEALAVKIQQLKEDKIKMLQVPKNNTKCSDRCTVDFSTAYMDLPEYKSESKASSKSSSSSLDEDELFRRLTEINYEFVGQMKQLERPIMHRTDENRAKESGAATVQERLASTADSPEVQDSSHQDSLNRELIDRIRRLQDRPDAPSQNLPVNQPSQPVFVPFLSDIPVLPKFEPQESSNSNSNQLSHKRPPPSKGLASIKKLNGNVTLVPHELSTIVEADSQLSTKVPSPESSRESGSFNPQLLVIPELQECNSSGSTPMARVSDKKVSPPSSQKLGFSKSSSDKTSSTTPKDDSNKSVGEFMSLLDSTSKSKDSEKSKDSCDDPCRSMDKKTSSSSSTDDLERTEYMLRSIGMQWAIPTLYKTQEALALTSSSSSLDLSRKKRKDTQTTVSGSEISLREFLYKHLQKISSSTMITDTVGSFLGESSELSGILKAVNTTRDKQRTSTPLGSSKFMSSSKSNAAFSDSELSSISQERSKKKKEKKDNK